VKLREVELGTVPSGCTLAIQTPAANGFFANALLERDEATVTSWESTELCGQAISRRLIAAGTYTLRETLAFIKTATVKLTFSVSKDSVTLSEKSVVFTCRKEEIGRAKVFITVSP